MYQCSLNNKVSYLRDTPGMGPDLFCVKTVTVRLKLNLSLADPFKSSVYFNLRWVLRILGPIKIPNFTFI